MTETGIVIFTHYKYEKSIRSSEDDAEEERTALVERLHRSDRDVALPAYSPIATTEDEAGARLLGRYSDIEHDAPERDGPTEHASTAIRDEYVVRVFSTYIRTTLIGIVSYRLLWHFMCKIMTRTRNGRS